MHVDGFRFDLATELARNHSGFNTLHPFFQVIQQTRCSRQVKVDRENRGTSEEAAIKWATFPPVVGMERQISRLGSQFLERR
jgi:glycogen operon protein